MIRNVIFAAAMMLSLNAFADASALVGKWMSDCQQGDTSGQVFVKSYTEFKADGTAVGNTIVFSDNQCTTEVSNDPSTPANYTATDTEFHITATDSGHTMEVIGTWAVNGDKLSVTIVQFLVDGKQENQAAQTVVLSRAN